MIFPCTLQLYGGVVPVTVKNFVSLLTGDNPEGITYEGTGAYRVLDGLNIQVLLVPATRHETSTPPHRPTREGAESGIHMNEVRAVATRVAYGRIVALCRGSTVAIFSETLWAWVT